MLSTVIKIWMNAKMKVSRVLSKDTPKSQHEEISSNIENSDNYNIEENRLRTFSSWPSNAPVNPERLAKSGLYYSGKEDEVICFSCHGYIRDWQYGDIVQKRHKKLFPHCDFVNNKSANVPLVKSRSNTSEEVLSSSVVAKQISGSDRDELTSVLKKERALSDEPRYEKPENVVPTNSICVSSNRALSSSNEDSSADTDIQLELSKLVPDLEAMKWEEERLKSYLCGWPTPAVAPRDLAKAGFFYLGFKDKVQCAYCEGIVKDWSQGDIPVVEHLRHFPYCHFALSYAHSQKNPVQLPSLLNETDSCSTRRIGGSSTSEQVSKLLEGTLYEQSTLNALGVNVYSGPAHPQQATLTARLRSFLSWPDNVPVHKEHLAAAGFFYIGISDHVRCFHCDGGLHSWDVGDDPWVEHAHWFRNCSFIRLSKGAEFINSCVNSAKSSAVAVQAKPKHFVTAVSNATNAVFTSSFMTKLEDAMQSSLICEILKTSLYPPYLVRAAVSKQLKENGIPFSNVDEVCEAVNSLREQMLTAPTIMCSSEESERVTTRPIAVREKTHNTCRQDELSSAGKLAELKSATTEEVEKVLKNDAVQQEYEESNEQRLCKVCMDNDVGVVFLPCGHLLACTVCAVALSDCPSCRKPIQATVRAFLL